MSRGEGGSCERLLASLEDCRRKHRLSASQVCKHLESAAAWCMLSEVCPTEVEDVNNCVGRYGGAAAGMAPGAVPRRCAAAAQRLQNCLEEQQRLQEAAATAQ